MLIKRIARNLFLMKLVFLFSLSERSNARITPIMALDGCEDYKQEGQPK